MKEAIQKAIEGGYTTWAGANPEDYVPSQVLLDPLFWSSLGKAMGWDSFTYKKRIGTTSTSFRTRLITVKRKSGVKDNWKAHWHRFIDHLAEGKDADSFFNELLI